MAQQVAVGKRIHSPGANEHRTRCCSGHPGMVQAAAPRAHRPTENALMGFCRGVGGTTFVAMRWPRHDAENVPSSCFHLAIIHENEYLVVKILLCPLHLRMRCSESTSFCNKRGFMWVFVRAVSQRTQDAPESGSRTAFPLTPADVVRVSPGGTSARSPAACMGRPPHLPCHFRSLYWGRSPRVPRFIC